MLSSTPASPSLRGQACVFSIAARAHQFQAVSQSESMVKEDSGAANLAKLEKENPRNGSARDSTAWAALHC